MSYLDTDLDLARRECHDLSHRCQSVHLLINSDEGELYLGSSPCVQIAGDYHVFVNQNPALTDCLLSSGEVELLFRQESAERSHDVRDRQLRISGQASTVPRGMQHTRIMVAFQDRLGSFMDVVRGRPDARLIRVRARAGRYLNELAQAFTFKENRLETLTSEIASTPAAIAERHRANSEVLR